MCRKPLFSSQRVCDVCAHEIELFDPIQRCPLCFFQKEACTAPCLHCMRQKPHSRIFGQACCLRESSLTDILLKQLMQKQDYHIERALASYAYIQLDRLEWPAPDWILLEPTHWLLPHAHMLSLSHRIAKQLAHLMKVPVLKMRLDPSSLPNPLLPLEEQLSSGHEKIRLLQKVPLYGSNLLLFSLCVQKGTTWNVCARSLEQCGLPRMRNLALIASDQSWIT